MALDDHREGCRPAVPKLFAGDPSQAPLGMTVTPVWSSVWTYINVILSYSYHSMIVYIIRLTKIHNYDYFSFVRVSSEFSGFFPRILSKLLFNKAKFSHQAICDSLS